MLPKLLMPDFRLTEIQCFWINGSFIDRCTDKNPGHPLILMDRGSDKFFFFSSADKLRAKAGRTMVALYAEGA